MAVCDKRAGLTFVLAANEPEALVIAPKVLLIGAPFEVSISVFEGVEPGTDLSKAGGRRCHAADHRPAEERMAETCRSWYFDDRVILLPSQSLKRIRWRWRTRSAGH